MKAMILAAGRGERLRPLTDSLPKPLIAVAGKPLIEYHLEKLAAYGIKDVVINCAWLGHKLPEQLGSGERWGVNIHYSHEAQALETAGGIANALDLLGDEPFLVINGDIFIESLPDIKAAQSFMQHNQLAMWLWLVENPQHNPSGDFALEQTMLKALTAQQTGFTFSGMGIYHPKAFAEVGKGKAALGKLIKQWLVTKQVAGAVYPQYWCDVGTIERLNNLEKIIVQGEVNTNYLDQ